MRSHTANNFGNIAGRIGWICRIDTLRGISKKKILPNPEARLLEDGQNNLSGRSRVGGAFENDELARTNVNPYSLDGSDDVREIRIFILSKRRGDANVERVQRFDRRER